MKKIDWDMDYDQKCKKKKSKVDVVVNQNSNQNQNELATAGPSNVEQTSGIFKMDIDCFEELFEWLSAAELRTLSCTCKRLKRIVNYYIRTIYPKIGKFELNDENFDMFRKMDSGTIGLIRKINVSLGSDFDGAQLLDIKEILNRVKKIIIMKWKTNSDFYNCFLKYCNNVKWLSIKWPTKGPNIYFDDEWLKHAYPSLEYFGIDDYRMKKSMIM